MSRANPCNQTGCYHCRPRHANVGMNCLIAAMYLLIILSVWTAIRVEKLEHPERLVTHEPGEIPGLSEVSR